MSSAPMAAFITSGDGLGLRRGSSSCQHWPGTELKSSLQPRGGSPEEVGTQSPLFLSATW